MHPIHPTSPIKCSSPFQTRYTINPENNRHFLDEMGEWGGREGGGDLGRGHGEVEFWGREEGGERFRGSFEGVDKERSGKVELEGE